MAPEPEVGIPVELFDLSKRYDLYCSDLREDRLYENVKIVAVRSFEPKHEHGLNVVGAYLEIEAPNGVRMMIKHFGIDMICEHGAKPTYQVLRVRKSQADE